MFNLGEYYNTHIKRGDVGIEIECESNAELPNVAEKGWVSHVDASLRGHSMEYVTSNPIVITAVGEYLDNLKRKLDGYHINDSFRTSVHVHKNMLKYSPLQIWNAVTVYWIVEELLYHYCGDSRKNNTFCLRLRDAEAVVDACLYDISLDYPFKSFKNNNTVRYGGANLAAIRKFGTVEFRGMRGTVDTDVIKTWVTELSGLVDTAAIQFDSPEHLLDTFYAEDKEKFLNRFIGHNLSEYVCEQDADWKQTLQNGAERVLPLAYSTDWKKWQTKMDEGKEKKVYNGTIGQEADRVDEELRYLRRAPRAAPIRRGVNWGLADPIVNVNIPQWAVAAIEPEFD